MPYKWKDESQDLKAVSLASEGAKLSRRASDKAYRVANVMLGYVLLLIGITTAISGIFLMWVGYSPVPFWDEYSQFLQYFTDFKETPLQWIWALHNEHRIIFYKVMLIIDMRLFHGRSWPFYIAICLCQLGLLLALGWILVNLGELKGYLWSSCFGIALFCLFCASQWENFFWAFQFSFVLTNFLAVASIACLVAYQRVKQLGRGECNTLLVASLAMGSSATFASGAGIAIWPALIAVAWISSTSWHILVLYLGGAVTISPFYLVGYHSQSPTQSPLMGFHQPFLLVQYVETYLGGTVIPLAHKDWSSQIGLLGIVTAGFLLVWSIRQRAHSRLMEAGLAGLLLYSMFVAILTALGRYSFGIDQAQSSRYQSFSLLFWFALAVWIITIAAQLRADRVLLLLHLALAVIFLASFTEYSPILKMVRDKVLMRNIGGIAMISGVHDEDYLLKYIFPFPGVIWPVVDNLRSAHLSLFSSSLASHFGISFTQNYRVVSSDRCMGYLDVFSRGTDSRDGLRLQGWAVDRRTMKPLPELLFVSDDRVVGFGLSGIERPDVAEAIRSTKGLYSGWMGYAKVSGSPGALDIYAVSYSGEKAEACPLKTIELQ